MGAAAEAVAEEGSTHRQAVERRRANRRSRREADEKRERARAERFAGRMLVRVLRRQETIDLWKMDARYWQARRCGWDPLGDELRQVVGITDDGQKIREEPEVTSFWRWWVRLTFTDRQAVVHESRLMRARL